MQHLQLDAWTFSLLFFLAVSFLVTFILTKKRRQRVYAQNTASLPTELLGLCNEAFEHDELNREMFCASEIPSTREVCNLILSSDALSKQMKKRLESPLFSTLDHPKLKEDALQILRIRKHIVSIAELTQLSEPA